MLEVEWRKEGCDPLSRLCWCMGLCLQRVLRDTGAGPAWPGNIHRLSHGRVAACDWEAAWHFSLWPRPHCVMTSLNA